MKNKLTLLIFLATACWSVRAQQTNNFTQAFINPYLLSPTYAGNTGDLKVFAHYRNQMLGFKGAPESMMLTLDKGLPHEKMGLGLQVFNDKINIIQRFGANLSYSYMVKIDSSQNIRLGLSAGVVSTGIDMQNVVASSPDELQSFSRIRPFVNFSTDFGVTYTRKSLQAGIAVTNINYVKQKLESGNFSYLQNPVYQFFVSYKLPIGNDVSFNPLVIGRSSLGTEFMVSVNAIFNFKKFIWAGITYDSRASIGATAGLRFDNLTVGYNYGYPTSSLANVSAGIHELCVGYTFGSKPKVTSNDPAASADNYSTLEDQTAALKANSISAGSKKTDTLYHVFIVKDGLDPEFLRKAFLGDIQNIYAEESNRTIDDVSIEGLAKLEPKDGLERFKKDYPKGKASVILAAYYKFEDVKKYQKLLLKRADLTTTVIKSRNDTYFLVSTKEVESYSEAVKEIKRVKNQKIDDLIFGNIWLY